MFRGKHRDNIYGLSEIEFNQLAKYNSEVARGIMHTEEWKQKMAQLQKTYNDELDKEFPNGYKIMDAGQ